MAIAGASIGSHPGLQSLLAIPLVLLAGLPVLAQNPSAADVRAQRQTMQSLLEKALVAIEQDDAATACRDRAEALAILNSNAAAFEALYPSNNWGSLQRSLQGSVATCKRRGLL